MRTNDGMGSFAMATVAYRARELGAQLVVFEAYEEVVPFYRRLGANEGCPGRWHRDRSLVQMHLSEDVVNELAEGLDAWPTENE